MMENIGAFPLQLLARSENSGWAMPVIGITFLVFSFVLPALLRFLRKRSMDKQQGQQQPPFGTTPESETERVASNTSFRLQEEQRQKLVACYTAAKEGISFPGGEAVFRCNLPIFGIDPQTDVRDGISFFFWRDSRNLYLFPNLDSLEEHFFRFSFEDFDPDVAVNEIRLTTIPLDQMAYFAGCEDRDAVATKSYLHPVRESTGELVVPKCTEVVVQYQHQEEEQILWVEPSSFSVFERWFPEKEYHAVLLQKQNETGSIKEPAKEKTVVVPVSFKEEAIDLESQLEELKSLFQKGLIQEADYQAKKTEILQEYMKK